MTTNQILNASFLDILFENRNKEYGAYTIRKEYPKNLMKAMGFMLLLVFAISLYVKSRPTPHTFRVTPVSLKPDHKLENIKELEKPKEQALQRFVTDQPPTRLDRVPIIVDNPDPDKNVPDRTDTATFNPGPTTTLGTGGNSNIVPGIVSDNNVIVQNPVETKPAAPEPAILSFSEVSPEFPGGTEAWIKYLQRMLRVPDDLETGDRKTVLVKFVVNAEGNVTDAIVIKSGGNTFDKEVLRVIARMPKWKPGKQNGKAVAVYFTQPVTFAASED